MSADIDTLALIAELEDPQRIYPGNFETEGKAVAILLCLCQDAAIEIRRMHAVNAELLKALNDLAQWGDGEIGHHMDEPYAAQIARAAIDKAEEQA